MRNYKRKADYKPMTEEQLQEARHHIRTGCSIRQAAKEIGFNEKTLRDRLKKGGGTQLGRYRRTFTAEQEKELVRHCVALDQRFFGLTLKSLRYLLFKYAEDNSISHQFSMESHLAGRDFTREFMKRNNLSLRVPRKTSVARAMGFNRVQLSQYFENLGSALKKYEFTPNQIYNMDETGVQTVPNKLPLHIAPTGKREVAKAVAAEQGQTVTAVCAMNALGNYVPPFFIYGRKRENRQLIRDGPTGCEMAVTEKGYMNTPTFLKWLQHFKNYVNPSKENPILLILDNHISHTSLEAVTFAKSHHIHLLTLPPHSSHKTQPLDRCFFGPLKSYYDAAVDAWDVSNPGQAFDVYNVAATFKVAFEKAGTIATAVQGFRATGIHPFDPNIFKDADFLPSEVTNQQQPEEEEEEDCDNRTIILHSEENVDKNEGVPLSEEIDPAPGPSDSSAIPQPQDYDDNPEMFLTTPSKFKTQAILPEDIIPLPKIKIQRKRSGKGLKSMLLTWTPNKERRENEAKEREKLVIEKEMRIKKRQERAEEKKRKLEFVRTKSKKGRQNSKRPVVDSSDSDADDFSVHDSSSDFDPLFNEEENDQEVETATTPQSILDSTSLMTNSYALVKVQGKTKNSFRHYVAKIISMCSAGYEVVFYKKLPGAYKFIATPEESFVENEDIVLKLTNPSCINSARFHNAITFSDDLSDFTIY